MNRTRQWNKRRRCFKTEEDNDVLRGFKYKYIYTGTSRYKRKTIQWLYPGWDRTFGKSWNFRDHALMHEGLKPYVWSTWNKSFTQKGNLRKHIRLHEVNTIKERKVYDWIYWNKSYTERYNLRVSIFIISDFYSHILKISMRSLI